MEHTAPNSPSNPSVTRVNVNRREPDVVRAWESLLKSDLESDLERARLLADWLDAKFSVAGVRFGLDTLLGLVPVVGDTIATLIGLYPLHIARQHKLGRVVQLRMAGNLLADWAIGLIPLAGDLFDIGFKGNLRNFRLLQKAAAKRTGAGHPPPAEHPRP